MSTLLCIDAFLRYFQVKPDVRLPDPLHSAAMPIAVGTLPALISGQLLLGLVHRSQEARIGCVLAMLDWMGSCPIKRGLSLIRDGVSAWNYLRAPRRGSHIAIEMLPSAMGRAWLVAPR